MENTKNTIHKKPVPLHYIARTLNVSAKWIRQEVEAGNIPALKTGTTYLFDYDTVSQILLERAKRGGEKC